jgi:hypothetical protein
MVFTCLLEWPEFAQMDSRTAEHITTELTAEVQQLWDSGDKTDAFTIFRAYRDRIGEGNLTAHAETRGGLGHAPLPRDSRSGRV